MLSNTNSISRGPYVFQPTKYDENGNLYCKVSKRHKYMRYVKDKCKLTGLYDFNNGKFEIIYTTPGFLNRGHKKLLEWFLKQYDWNLNKNK